MFNCSLVTCYKCGIEFGLKNDFLANLKSNANIFSCPNGHEQSFAGDKSKVKKLEEELSRQRERADSNWYEAEHQKRRVAAYKGKLTIEKRKINKNGK